MLESLAYLHSAIVPENEDSDNRRPQTSQPQTHSPQLLFGLCRRRSVLALGIILGILLLPNPAIATRQEGDRGTPILQLPKSLPTSGYDSPSPTEDLENISKTAILPLQRENELLPDTMVGNASQTALNRRNSPPYQAQAKILRRGDRGEEVRKLQELLQAIGVYEGPLSGIYGEATEAAVRRFQRERGLIEDGIAGDRTLAAISAVARSQSRPSPSPATPTFTLGSEGDAVREIQQRLQILGYLSSSPTGAYDETTREAVTKFQRDRGLTADGIVGENTIAALERSIRPEQIRELQERLKEAGFYNGAIDGIWGTQTQEAIEAARKNYGVSAADLTQDN